MHTGLPQSFLYSFYGKASRKKKFSRAFISALHRTKQLSVPIFGREIVCYHGNNKFPMVLAIKGGQARKVLVLIRDSPSALDGRYSQAMRERNATQQESN